MCKKIYVCRGINFLGMIRIGIIGSDKRLLSVVDQIKAMENIRLTGFLSEEGISATAPCATGYVSIEELLYHIDAVLLSSDVSMNTELIERCLKKFKHVLAIDVRAISYERMAYLEKIAEESNVIFYPDFGETLISLPKTIGLTQFCYAGIKHSINYYSEHENLSDILIQDINWILNLSGANIKKINASGWSFCNPGSGMLNVRLDFDNGSTANIVLENLAATKQFQASFYDTFTKTNISFEGATGQVIVLSLKTGEAEGFTIAPSQGVSLLKALSLFISAIAQEIPGLRALEAQFKTIRVNNLVHERINSYSSKNILYS